MKHKLIVLLLFAIGTLSGGCFMPARPPAAVEEADAAPPPQEDIYRSFPQLLTLEQKLDRASTYFFFGDRASATAAAQDLLQSVADLREMSPGCPVCDHLDYLENRARCLLQRISDDELESQTEPYMAALVDSVARTTVVEEEIEIEYNSKTNYWIDYFKGSGRKHFSRWLERTGEFQDVIEPILTDVGIPRDLLYLAVIESGLNMTAQSYMKAIGPWQFMLGTAKLFGLRVNWWIDERRDIIASTYAAAYYLKYLHDLFGSWPLALAAYNSGEHRVAYAITRQRTTDYWQLNLPAQTTWFVPKFMAALAIGRNPEEYGFERPQKAPLKFDVIEVERPFDLASIAGAAGCSLIDIKDLNPHFKKWCTPPDMVVEVKVPQGTGDQCAARLADMKQQKLVSYVQHRVKRGETLSSIAAQYEVSVKELKKANEIGSSPSIRTGAVLIVPVKDTARSVRLASRPSYRNPDRRLDQISLPLLSASDEGNQIRYTVRRDDNLVKIAERFHTSLAEIREWNKLSCESVIRPGDTLWIRMIPSDGRVQTAAAASAVQQPPDSGGAASASPAAAAPDSLAKSGARCITHMVRKGETLTSIGRLYKVRISEILSWNPKADRNRLYSGDKLKIWTDGR
ncbi:MAG: LysM peptidoglycan-binding domain-containing protein [Candidatus Krumholzibacteriaceae bacterium]|jgi:membrane-bound lytic murein transglycosylase D